MSTLKEVKVIMLPTSKAENCILSCKYQIEYYKGYMTQEYLKEIGKTSHNLYFISEDKIEEGEEGHFYDFNYNKLCKVARDVNGDKFFKYRNIKKIIATTDTQLKVQGSTPEESKEWKSVFELPSPSIAFIEKFCKLGGIEKVLVEYDSIRTNPDEPDFYALYKETLKIDSHNTITIHPIKDSWSREEVEKLILQSHIARNEMKNPFDDIPQWIDKNL